ncbi:MAG: SPOR domain-containing protein [Sphingomonadales bacterium]|nr:SPOR domain-containing protein [Sphingomonadales bacterium]MBD3772160.1 SPOR domain-containing protein [Paracoccaceae bacterium]
MRLPVDVRFPVKTAAIALGLTLLLGGCGLIGGSGGDRPQAALSPGELQLATAGSNGPEADYPMVLGDPFKLDGQLYTPADTLNYDTVGYASLDAEGGQGATASHKTLPLPSYVEITDLDSGRTILVRVERRGPMSTTREIALSPAALDQLGAHDGSPVRVRRVNPPEIERAELRAGKAAPVRMETPKSLLAVLSRKLPANGSASLRSAAVDTARQQAEATGSVPPLPKQAAATPVAVAPPPAGASFTDAFAHPVVAKAPATASAPGAKTVPTPAAVATSNPKSYALQPLETIPRSIAARPQPTTVAPRPAQPAAVAAPTATTVAKAPAAATAGEAAVDRFVVQAAAFSSKANADRAAQKLGGKVSRAGSYYRVQTGPYATRGQAEAALAKVRAAGYSDARVFTAG